MTVLTDDWRKDQGRCVLNDMGECLAKIPIACICSKMPKHVYLSYLERLWPTVGESAGGKDE